MKNILNLLTPSQLEAYRSFLVQLKHTPNKEKDRVIDREISGVSSKIAEHSRLRDVAPLNKSVLDKEMDRLKGKYEEQETLLRNKYNGSLPSIVADDVYELNSNLHKIRQKFEKEVYMDMVEFNIKLNSKVEEIEDRIDFMNQW